MSAKTILAFGAGTWRGANVFGSPRYHLWGLAKLGWKVLYVDPPVRFLLSAPPPFRAADRDFQAITIPRVVPFAVRAQHIPGLDDLWRGTTASQLARGAQLMAAEMGVEPSVVWFGAPWHAALLPHLPSWYRIVHHVYDELTLSPAITGHARGKLVQWSHDLEAWANPTLCSSSVQLESRRGTARHVELLENAVSDEFLAECDRPVSGLARSFVERLRTLPRPVIGYGGVVDHRLDAKLLEDVLTTNPTASLAFLGKVDANADDRVKNLIASHSRVWSAGPVPYMAYPHLYRECDVLLIAHLRNPFTDAMFPEKLNEYLASGRPIVSIAMPEVVRVAAELPRGAITIGGKMNFGTSIASALTSDSEALQSARRGAAARRTWSQMAEKLDGLLGEHPRESPPNDS